MTGNALTARLATSTQIGKVSEELLHSYAHELNGNNFVRDSGKPYFVNRKADADGVILHFLDRAI